MGVWPASGPCGHFLTWHSFLVRGLMCWWKGAEYGTLPAGGRWDNSRWNIGRSWAFINPFVIALQWADRFLLWDTVVVHFNGIKGIRCNSFAPYALVLAKVQVCAPLPYFPWHFVNVAIRYLLSQLARTINNVTRLMNFVRGYEFHTSNSIFCVHWMA